MEIQENEYGDMFVCADDFSEEQPIHPGVWACINWEADLPDDLHLLEDEFSEWGCVFESSNPANQEAKENP